MDILKIVIPYIGGILTIASLEYVWLMHIMNTYIARSFGDLVVTENGRLTANIIPGLFAWAVIVLLWYIFVIRSGYAHSFGSALFYGATIGGLTYAMYDLTNLAFIKNYPLAFSYLDMAWGSFLGASVCCVMYYLSMKIS